MTEVIYLAPLCQEHERMWCEHDAPVDCECIDGPHPWIKYVAAPKQLTQSDAEIIAENKRLREALELCLDELWAPQEGCSCHISPPCEDCVEYQSIREAIAVARATLKEQSK